MAAKFDVYEEVTRRITEQLDKGVIPWRKPWKTARSLEMFPCFSFVGKKRYDILNQILLNFEPGEYITFNQCKKLGGHVKKGEKGHFVVGWVVEDRQKKNADGTPATDENGDPITEKTFGLRYYNVFNILTQVEGIDPKMDWTTVEDTETVLQPSEVAEEIINNYIHSADGPKFEAIASDRAFYSPAMDSVTVPRIEQYENIAEYYSTAFHELTHSTMKSTRCNREEDRKGKKVSFGSTEYSKEELVAEIGAAALVNYCGLETTESFNNSASYIEGWSRKLKEQPKMIVYASAQAQKAIDYILAAKAVTTEKPEITPEQKQLIDDSVDYMGSPFNNLGDSVRRIKDNGLFEKYEDLSNRHVALIEKIYEKDLNLEAVKDAATELKKSIARFGYTARKFDKTLADSVDNFKVKANIDQVISLIEDIYDTGKAERAAQEAYEAIAELEAIA